VECAAHARALEPASRRQTPPERAKIFTDAQAAIRRMVSEEPSPGQMYALQAGKHIAVLWRVRPDIAIEIRWCPAQKGVVGNEKADEWTKLAAEERGYLDRAEARTVPLPGPLAHLKREISEKKWAEARQWAGARTSIKSTGCRADRSPTSRLRVVPRSLPRGFTSLCSFLCSSLWCASYFLGITTPWRRVKGACNVPPPRGQQTGIGEKARRYSLDRLNASMIKLKKKDRASRLPDRVP